MQAHDTREQWAGPQPLRGGKAASALLAPGRGAPAARCRSCRAGSAGGGRGCRGRRCARRRRAGHRSGTAAAAACSCRCRWCPPPRSWCPPGCAATAPAPRGTPASPRVRARRSPRQRQAAARARAHTSANVRAPCSACQGTGRTRGWIQAERPSRLIEQPHTARAKTGAAGCQERAEAPARERRARLQDVLVRPVAERDVAELDIHAARRGPQLLRIGALHHLRARGAPLECHATRAQRGGRLDSAAAAWPPAWSHLW